MAEAIRSFRDLVVWQQAHALVLDIYQVTKNFPSEERFGLTSQLRRAAYSIAANIVEGFGRRSTKEFLQALNFSNGSLEETRYCLMLSFDLKYVKVDDRSRLEGRCTKVGQLLGALRRALMEKTRNTEHGTRNTR